MINARWKFEPFFQMKIYWNIWYWNSCWFHSPLGFLKPFIFIDLAQLKCKQDTISLKYCQVRKRCLWNLSSWHKYLCKFSCLGASYVPKWKTVRGPDFWTPLVIEKKAENFSSLKCDSWASKALISCLAHSSFVS